MNNHVTEEERMERIKRVLELINSGMSYRECAKYLTENEFKISHFTVKYYVDKAEELRMCSVAEAKEVIKNNAPKTIEDEEVQKRIKKVYELLKENYTIEQIAKALESTPMIIYRDFKRMQTLNDEQLKKLSIEKEVIEQIKNSMTEKSLKNLKNQNR
ncbi:MAG: hypothetical protein E7170_00320 [Firmicutes bacterium]|nr:hypothetical protein [Bacillota bacterium]